MKKFRIAALMMCFVALSMAFTSCQKNEDLIIGQWKLVKVTENNTAVQDATIGAIYEFKADNTFTMSYQGYSVSGTYTIDGDNFTLTVSVGGMSQSETGKIEKLNKTTLIVSQEDGKQVVEFEKI